MHKLLITMATYNRVKLTKLTVDSLYKTSSPDEFDLVVIDNGSTDATNSYLKELKGRYANFSAMLLPRNIGVAKAHNLALLHNYHPGSYWTKLDNDCEIRTDGWISKKLDVFSKLPDYGVICAISGVEGTMPKSLLHTELPIFTKTVTSGMLVTHRPEVIEKIGYYDEGYGKYGWEDCLYAVRSEVAGYKTAYYQNMTHRGTSTIHAKHLQVDVPDKPSYDLQKKQSAWPQYDRHLSDIAAIRAGGRAYYCSTEMVGYADYTTL